ncbi:permease prefix domain 1-containing protein [Paenibacillus solani]|uniref:permease prefix domain 1-containing protein n=1 Tax=Paenibacillus solani TaxID=1705565 RepID=UPI003D2CF5E7
MYNNSNDLEIFVERLFANQRKTKEVVELKNEVLSNLEARVSDYLENGMEYQSAISLAIHNIDDIETLIDDNQKVYSYRLRYELVQSTLIYSLLAWICTIPFRFVASGIWANMLFLCIVILSGALYLSMSRHLKRYDKQTGIINAGKLAKWRKWAWSLWGVFIMVMWAYTFIIQFGSDVWFGRELRIQGPYSFYATFVPYAIPLTSILIPLLIRKASKLTTQLEVKEL